MWRLPFTNRRPERKGDQKKKENIRVLVPPWRAGAWVERGDWMWFASPIFLYNIFSSLSTVSRFPSTGRQAMDKNVKLVDFQPLSDDHLDRDPEAGGSRGGSGGPGGGAGEGKEAPRLRRLNSVVHYPARITIIQDGRYAFVATRPSSSMQYFVSLLLLLHFDFFPLKDLISLAPPLPLVPQSRRKFLRGCRGCTCHAVCGYVKQFFRSSFFAAVIYLALCMFTNCFMQVWAQERSTQFDYIPRKYNMTEDDMDKILTLPDLGFDLFPYMPYASLPDTLVGLMMGITIFRFMLTSMRATIFRRWMLALGTLFLIRSLSIVSTLLPNPFKSCEYNPPSSNWLVQAFMILTGQLTTCADTLFSGHSVNATLTALVWQHYSDVVPVMCSLTLMCKRDDGDGETPDSSRGRSGAVRCGEEARAFVFSCVVSGRDVAAFYKLKICFEFFFQGLVARS